MIERGGCEYLISTLSFVVSGEARVKPSKEVPSDSLQNPSDPDATYDGYKG
jgi:hypothetical protein